MHSQSSRPKLELLLVEAARGSDEARESLLGLYRPYLRLVAGRRMPKLVQQRIDASDIVQQTLVDAVRGLPEFRGQSEPEFTAWMIRLLERNVLMSVRNHTLGKRIGEGMSLADAIASSAGTAEGVSTARSIQEFAHGLGVDVPICDAVVTMLAGEVQPEQVLSLLLSRPRKAEVG